MEAGYGNSSPINILTGNLLVFCYIGYHTVFSYIDYIEVIIGSFGCWSHVEVAPCLHSTFFPVRPFSWYWDGERVGTLSASRILYTNVGPCPTTWLILILLLIGNMHIAQILLGKYLILLHILETRLIPRGPSSQRQRLGIAIAFSFLPISPCFLERCRISFFLGSCLNRSWVGSVWAMGLPEGSRGKTVWEQHHA